MMGCVKLDAKRLYKHIMSLSSSARISLLTNDNVRTIFMSDEAHYPFVWLVQGLDGIELKYFVDSNYLTDILNKKPDSILTHQRILVAIARAYVKEPSIVLLDEPFVILTLL